MKGLLLAVLPILCNVLLSQGQNNNDNSLATDYPMGSEVTQNISFNSILEDINNFYNKNVKYQVVANNDETKETSGDANANGNNNTANNNSNANGNANTNANGNNNNNANNNSNANGNSNTNNSNNNTNNNTGNNNTNGNTNNNNNGNANNNNNNVKGGNANANGNTKTDGTGDDEEPVKETGCGSDRASLGMFAFHKPIKRSILVINSNFTIIWSYNNILEGYEYNYPQNDVTIKLFYEDDANPNNWSNAWKSPVFEKVIPFSEIEDGPVINGIRTFQYNWLINPKVDKSFKMSPKSSEKYKLRIYGDGKDVQSNSANFQCYSDGDIQPGLTVAFYIVDNTYIDKKYYKPLPIEDKSAGVQSKASLMMTFVIAIFLILYNY